MRPSDGRISLWPVAVILVVVGLAALSITSTVKLNTVPPSDFVALRASAAGPKATLAGQYWEVAAHVIQWKYNRTSALPEQVPAEFTLADTAGKATKIEDQAARGVYWAKLREEWLSRDNWHTSYAVDLLWPIRNAKSLSHSIHEFINQT
jgi:hypothetical protein